MGYIVDALTEWFKELLVGGIISNLSGMFDSVNQKVGEIAGQVGTTPQAWNGGIYDMIHNLSETVILPIAGVILAFVMTLELIQLITEKNNLHDIDTWMFFKWIFKTACAILIVTNTWTIVMGIFDAAQGDGFDDLRQEYTTMLQNQLAKGNNGLIKTKYLTFGIDADNYKSAKPRLERVETDILNNFKRLGVAAASLNGFERLRLMHDVFHMDEQQQFRFSWDWLPQMGLSVKDFIAPSSFEFAKGNSFAMGGKVGAVSFLQLLAPELNDRMLADFLDMESSLIVTMHIQSVDQVKAIKTIKRKITDLDRMKMDEQKKAVRAGYDMLRPDRV